MLTPSRVSRFSDALIGIALDDHGIAAGEQGGIDEVERLQRAGDDQDVVGGAGDAAVAL